MNRDRLFLLKPKFTDDALPGRDFHCKECTTIRGLLNSFPDAAAKVDVEEVEFPRPRAAIVELIGQQNQGAPVLVFADDAAADLATGEHGRRRFVNRLDQLLHALHVRHGFPEVHP